ncbi:GPW/gp25 family protein [Dyella marensis]|uniref:GPW/gp25 family protein n=1 Tax=Dyella marensis TaxID=500610 RepID=UPI0031E11825
MSRTTGAMLPEIEHIAQSVADILSTPLGSRLARRTYGSRLFDLLDAPVNATTRVRLFAATATALMRWEKRITVQRVALTAIDGLRGRFALDITGSLATGDAVALSVPLTLGGAV